MLSLALLLSCSWEPADAFAEDQGTETVKVGYYEDGDYMSCNPQGEYAGYNIEFLQELSKQSGLQFEIVDAGSWNAAYSMLVDGEIDLLPSVYYDPERAKEVSFVAQPMCTIYTTLNVRMDDDRYNYEDFEAFSGMNVGIIRGGIDGERFKEFCHEHQVELNIEEYDETELLLSALDDGILDGVAITHLGKNSTFRSVAQFAPSPLFFAVNAEDTELLNDLNRTMDSILLSNPSYETDLYDKYLAPSSNQKPVFTKEELQYIQQGKTVVVAYEPSFAPLSYREEKTGEFKGVTADIFKFIAENSGLIFQFEAHPQNEALELLQQGKVDVLCLTDGDYLWDRKNKFNSTLYYLRTPTSMITRYGAGKPEKLALPQGYQLSETVAKDNPDCEIRYYPSAQACLDAVQNREADAAYMNTQVGGFLMDGARYRGMNEAALGQYTNKMCAGISLSADPRLFSIMNKCIQYLPVEQVDAFLVANSVNAKKISLAEFAGQHIWAVVCGVCLMLGIVILLISYNLRNALRSNRRIQELLYKDDLTGLDNINGFYKKWMAEAEDRKGKNFVLLYGDICQFKLINDNFGFAAGDQVLCACGRTFQEKVEEVENCIRVSADNFVLLLQYDTWESLVKRLKAAVENLDIWRREHTKLPYKIDMVFGVYLINETEDMKINQMLDFANYARRHAKETPGCFACLYDEQMRKDAILALQLEGELEAALNRNDFVVYYQPRFP